MNRDRIEGGWKQVSGKVLELWSALLHDESGITAARRIQQAGDIQVRHGMSKVEAERQLQEFLQRNRDWDTSSHW